MLCKAYGWTAEPASTGMACARRIHAIMTERTESQNVSRSSAEFVESLTSVVGPLAPGDTKTYTFLCTQFGTSWYHSHYSAQYGDGILGAIVINGPATSNYDVDLGSMTIQDWYYATAYQNSVRANT